MRHQRRRAALLAVTTLAMTGLPSAVANASGGNQLLGTVAGPDGRPLAGARVVVTQLLSETPARYKEPTLVEGVTGSTGRFALTLPVTPAMVNQAAFNDGAVNLQIRAEKTVPGQQPAKSDRAGDSTKQSSCTDDVLTTVEGSVPDLTEPTPTLTPDIGPDGGAVRPCVRAEDAFNAAGTATDITYAVTTFAYVTLDGAGAFDPGNEVVGALLSVPDPVLLETAVIPAAEGGTSDTECNPHYAPDVDVIDRSAPLEPFGELHVGWDSSARIDYGRTANTDMGGAYNYKGGGFKVTAGATHMGNKGTGVSAFRGALFGKVMTTQFEYVKEKLTFYGVGNVPCRTDYRVRATKWSGIGIDEARDVREHDGGVNFDKAKAKGYWGQFGVNTGWVKHEGRGEKYTADVRVFGLTLHGQSTWSTNLDITYSFGGGTADKHYLFSQDAHPRTAKNVYAW